MKAITKRLFFVMGVLFSAAGLAAESDAGWRGFVVGGLTKGGDSILTVVTIGTGATNHIYAGNFFQIGTGALWTAGSLPLAVSLSLNYHFDDAGGSNGSAQFKRVPLEAIAYYLSEDGDWRVGLGGRYVYRPRLEAAFENGGTTSTATYRFDDTKGFVVETGWRYGKHTWLNFRAVKELYQINTAERNGVSLDTTGAEETKGSHLGFNILYAF